MKTPVPSREPRLRAFIEKLEDDATVSFKRFRDPAELQDFVENDLALLLTERFVSVAGRTALRSPTGVAYYVNMAAGVAAGDEDHATAVRFFSASSATWTAAGAEVPPPLAKMHDDALAAAESSLDRGDLEKARADGEMLDAYEAADYAIAWLKRHAATSA